MSMVDKARSYNQFVQKSYQNSVTAVQKTHQNVAELYVNMLQLGGLPEEWGDKMKDTHGEFIDLIYGSVVDAFGEVGQLKPTLAVRVRLGREPLVGLGQVAVAVEVGV